MVKINKGYIALMVLGFFLTIANNCKKEEIEEGFVSDIDGNSYKTVRIGNQWWMAENLKTTSYNDGTEIPLVEDNSTWKGLTTGAYCWYDNIPEYKNVYGHLYNWYTLNTGNLCPTGWHAPSYEEWTILAEFLGGVNGAGGKLKETGTTHWISPNKGATNKTGFTAFPGGYRHALGPYHEIGIGGYWWSATETYPGTAWSIFISSNDDSLSEDMYFEKIWGFSVRCIKDN